METSFHVKKKKKDSFFFVFQIRRKLYSFLLLVLLCEFVERNGFPFQPKSLLVCFFCFRQLPKFFFSIESIHHQCFKSKYATKQQQQKVAMVKRILARRTKTIWKIQHIQHDKSVLIQMHRTRRELHYYQQWLHWNAMCKRFI